jgi:hypothetical protein
MLSIPNAVTATKYWLHKAYGACTQTYLNTVQDSATFFVEGIFY